MRLNKYAEYQHHSVFKLVLKQVATLAFALSHAPDACSL
jgi:hypothetical protein